MSSNTPQFDAALAEFFAQVKPGERTCKETGEKFEVSPKEIDLYRTLGVPPTELCFAARMRHQRSFLGGFDLFRRSLPDGSSVVSMYDPETPLTLMGQADWYKARFEDVFFRYAHTYDPSRSFFDQWKDFSFSVPRPVILNDAKNENSEWSVYTLESKNCYGTFGGAYGENLTYCDQGLRNQNCTEVCIGFDVTYSHDCVYCKSCAHTFFSQYCENCVSVYFSLGCLDCQDCFGCTNLKNKRFYFLNQPLSEEAYRTKLAQIDLSDARVVEEWTKKIREEYWKMAPRRASYQPNSEEAWGDDLRESRDVSGISMHGCERVHWAFGSLSSKDCIDVCTCLHNERVVNSAYITHGYEYRMCLSCTRCLDVEYSELLEGCEHCFGCIGLINKKYCIFNKQYTEAEYWPMVDQIKTVMLKAGEYGQFFPYSCSPIAYNVSHTSTFHTATQEEVERLGGRWYTFPPVEASATSIEELPLSLKETTDEVLKKTYQCPESGRAFRFVKPELELHRSFSVALPRIHPTLRRKAHMKDALPIRLWKRSCSDCGVSLHTRIPAENPALILCDLCFEKRMLAGTASV